MLKACLKGCWTLPCNVHCSGTSAIAYSCVPIHRSWHVGSVFHLQVVLPMFCQRSTQFHIGIMDYHGAAVGWTKQFPSDTLNIVKCCQCIWRFETLAWFKPYMIIPVLSVHQGSLSRRRDRSCAVYAHFFATLYGIWGVWIRHILEHVSHIPIHLYSLILIHRCFLGMLCIATSFLSFNEMSVFYYMFVHEKGGWSFWNMCVDNLFLGSIAM